MEFVKFVIFFLWKWIFFIQNKFKIYFFVFLQFSIITLLNFIRLSIAWKLKLLFKLEYRGTLELMSNVRCNNKVQRISRSNCNTTEDRKNFKELKQDDGAISENDMIGNVTSRLGGPKILRDIVSSKVPKKIRHT